MATLNLKQIMLDYHIEEREMANILFRENRYPEVALRRAIELQSNISVKQASTLADYLGVPIYALFTDSGWYSIPSESNVTLLRKGDVTAVINGDRITIRNKFEGVEHYIVKPKCLTVEELINLLEQELAKDLL